MCTANPLWGIPRIHGELLKLGIDLTQAGVGRYMPWRPKRPLLGAASLRVAELEAQLGKPPKNSSNSSVPPSKGFKANANNGKADILRCAFTSSHGVNANHAASDTSAK